jgi:tetratricopeptide (TPR) repeat protein
MKKMLRHTIAPLLTLILCSLNQQVSFAQQKSVDLDIGKCVTNSLSDLRERFNVSINKQVFSPLFRTNSASRGPVTCQVNPPNASKKFKVINFGFGVTPNLSQDAIITLYLDGKQVFSRQISPDEYVKISLDISQARDLAIETQAPRGSRWASNVIFFEASLHTDASTLVKSYKDQGDAQYANDEYQEAVASYTSAIRLSPRYAALYYNRGISYQSLENYELAYKDLEKASQLYKEQGRTQDYQDVSRTLNDVKQLIKSATTRQ